MESVQGEWKSEILALLKDRTMRLSEIQGNIPEANPRVVTKQLQVLEEEGIVERKVLMQIPPKTEYALTSYGKDLMKLFDNLDHNSQRS